MINFNLHKEKAVNSLLFVIDKLEKPDAHKVYKILYFADQKHLLKYGRPIFGDTYIKMKYGPVPSFLRNVVDENIKGQEKVVKKIDKHFIEPLAKPNLDFLSESDLECLNESIEENKDLDFDELTAKSHDEAYTKAVRNIDYLEMAKAVGADDNLLNFIKQQQANDNLALI